MPFWPLCRESKVILSKKFRPGHPSWSVHMGKFSFRLPRRRDLGNRARPASHMNTSKFLRRKEWRGEIASPVDRAHMNRP